MKNNDSQYFHTTAAKLEIFSVLT